MNWLPGTITTTPHLLHLLSNVQGTTVKILMKWSPAPGPTWPTHWEWGSTTTRPRLLLASRTPALQVWKEMVEQAKSGSIPRATTGTLTALSSSGPSCRKRRASWGPSLTQHCWPLMNTAERKLGMHHLCLRRARQGKFQRPQTHLHCSQCRHQVLAESWMYGGRKTDISAALIFISLFVLNCPSWVRLFCRSPMLNQQSISWSEDTF